MVGRATGGPEVTSIGDANVTWRVATHRLVGHNRTRYEFQTRALSLPMPFRDSVFGDGLP